MKLKQGNLRGRMALIGQSINTGYSIAHYLSSQFKTCVFPSASFILNAYSFGEQGWRSGESTRLPPLWTGFKSRRRHHMWVEFVVGSLPCSERFFSEYSGFPLSSKTNIPKFQFDQESGRRRTTMWMYYLQIVIYLFIYRLLIYAAANIQQNIKKNPCLTTPLRSQSIGHFRIAPNRLFFKARLREQG